MNAPQQQPREEFWMEDAEALIDERCGASPAELREATAHRGSPNGRQAMTARVPGGIRVREIDTTAGSMYEVVCALHQPIPATFNEDQAIYWASLHAAHQHHTRMLDLEVHYLTVKPGAA